MLETWPLSGPHSQARQWSCHRVRLGSGFGVRFVTATLANLQLANFSLGDNGQTLAYAISRRRREHFRRTLDHPVFYKPRLVGPSSRYQRLSQSLFGFEPALVPSNLTSRAKQINA